MMVLTFWEETEQGVFAEVCFHIAWHDHSIKPSPDPVLDKGFWISNVKANVISSFSFPSQSNFTVASATMLYVKYETKTLVKVFCV